MASAANGADSDMGKDVKHALCNYNLWRRKRNLGASTLELRDAAIAQPVRSQNSDGWAELCKIRQDKTSDGQIINMASALIERPSHRRLAHMGMEVLWVRRDPLCGGCARATRKCSVYEYDDNT